MHASTHALARHLADAAQAMGADAVSALAHELSARMGKFGAAIAVKVEPSPELGETEQDISDRHNRRAAALRAAAEAARASRPTVTATISAKDAAGFGDFGAATVATAFAAAVGAEDIPEVAERRAAWFEPGRVNHLAPGDRLTFTEDALLRSAWASSVKTDKATGNVEAVTIHHPLFTVEIKPRG